MLRSLRRGFLALAIAPIIAVCATPLFAASPAGDEPETVMITLRAKAGAEDALKQVIVTHWDTVRRLKMVRDDAPHLTLQGKDEAGHAYFVDIFTWRDARFPDAAPPEVQTIWKDMNALVEPRSGRPGLEITEMTPVR